MECRNHTREWALGVDKWGNVAGIVEGKVCVQGTMLQWWWQGSSSVWASGRGGNCMAVSGWKGSQGGEGGVWGHVVWHVYCR